MTSIPAARFPDRNRPLRRGFTLVEMLVAVSLVVLMMTLFAQIFQMATGSMATQKGIAENDQRARTLVNLIRSDLDKRSYRRVYACAANQDPIDAARATGYFYLSENSLDDDTDDVLQFTIRIDAPGSPNPDQTPLYGRATPLRPVGSMANPSTYFLTNPNQPEAEDLQVNSNFAGSSLYAEVSYFLRNNILYRRVQLIRDPSKIDAAAKEQPSVGSNGGGAEIFDPATPYSTTYAPGGTGNFLTDFDYSAYWNNGVKFHAAPASMNNLQAATPDASLSAPLSLGVPHLRFGHNISTGRPREFVAGNFIGRFTHEETSHASFTYPGNLTAGTNPMARGDLTFDTTFSVVTQYAGGPRRGEDIVMANVHGFDIKVFDDHPNISEFRDLGYGGTTIGFYHQNNNRNPNYGPQGSNNRCFDTWHASPSLTNLLGRAPFRPSDNGPDGAPGNPGVDDDSLNGADDSNEQGFPGTDDNQYPLKAIQIKIRFLDTSSNQLREITIVQSLVDI